MTDPIAFVTGATGQLGGHLVSLLVAHGYQVRALVRSAEKARRYLPTAGVQLIVGDMLDVDAFAAQLHGVDVVFHTAAYFREAFAAGADDTAMTRINVDATIALFDAAMAHDVQNIVYASALGVLRRPTGNKPFDETAPPNTHSSNAYFRSKVQAEEAIVRWLALPAVQKQRPRVVQILPGGMWGPGDAAPTGFGQFVIDYLEGKLPVILPGGVPFVDARDVAQAMMQAVTAGRGGERFIVSQRMASIAEIMQLLARVSGVPAPRVQLSFPVATALAVMAEAAARLTGRPPALTRLTVDALRGDFAVSSAKAEQELGVRYRPIEETLRDAVMWFRNNNYIKHPAKQQLISDAQNS